MTPSTSLRENLDTTTPGGRLVFHVFAALAEFIRELIVQGTREGLATARAHGRIGGRPTVVNDDLLRAARDMLPNPSTPSPPRVARPARSRPRTRRPLTRDTHRPRQERGTVPPRRPLTPQTAQITTASVEIKTLTVSGKQVTMAVFRQLYQEPLYDHLT
jgi:hypothetical protein